MYYFVIGADGQRYGPADIDTLVAWVAEGRIVGSTVLIERGTDRQLLASALPAIDAALRRAAVTGSGGPAPVVVERATAPELPTMTQSPHGRRQPPPLPASEDEGLAGRRVEVRPYLTPAKSKVAAGLLGIFLGWTGAHRFYLGYSGVGVVMLLGSLAGCCAIPVVHFPLGTIIGVWGLVEGIVCLCGGMRDAQGRELRD